MIEKDVLDNKWENLMETLPSFHAVDSYKLFSEEEYDRLKNEDGFVFCAFRHNNRKWSTFTVKWQFRGTNNGIWRTYGNQNAPNLLDFSREGFLILIAKINLPEIPDEL